METTNECTHNHFFKHLNQEGKKNPWEHIAKMAEKSGKYYDPNMKYICEEDFDFIENYNQSPKRKDENKIVTDILPCPFSGDVFNAKIIVLTLNPGFIKDINHTLYDMLNEEAQKDITKHHIRDLRLQGKAIVQSEPMNIISDRYWAKKTQELRKNPYNLQYSDFAVIQYMGYQSESFSMTEKQMEGLKSIEFTKLLVEFIAKNRKDNYCFVIARKENYWNPILEKVLRNDYNNKVTVLNSYLNPTISFGNFRDQSVVKQAIGYEDNTKEEATSPHP